MKYTDALAAITRKAMSNDRLTRELLDAAATTADGYDEIGARCMLTARLARQLEDWEGLQDMVDKARYCCRRARVSRRLQKYVRLGDRKTVARLLEEFGGSLLLHPPEGQIDLLPGSPDT